MFTPASIRALAQGNILPLTAAVVCAGAALGINGCFSAADFFGPRTADAQPIATMKAQTANVGTLGNVAAGVALVPSPLQPIAAAADNFTLGYVAQMQERITALEAKEANGETVTRQDVYLSNLLSVAAGISTLFVRRRVPLPAAAPPTPATPPASPG